MKPCSVLRRLLFFLVLPYLAYVAYQEGATSNLPALPADLPWSPLWHLASDHLAAADEKYQISPRVAAAARPVWAPVAAQVSVLHGALSHRWAVADATYMISYRARASGAVAKHWEASVRHRVLSRVVPAVQWAWARFYSWYTGSMGPIVQYYCSQYAASLERVVDASASHVRLQSYLLLAWAKASTARTYTLYVGPSVRRFVAYVWSHTGERLSELSWVQAAVAFLRSVQPPVYVSHVLQQKTEFLLSEIASFVQLNKSVGSPDPQRRLEEVQDILAHVNDPEVSDPKVSDPKVSDPKVSDPEVSDDSDSDADPVTLTSTLTQTVSSDLPTSEVDPEALDKPAEDSLPEAVETDSVATVQSATSQLDEELAFWKKRVANFLNLTAASLEDEFRPYLDPKVAQLTEDISANFTALQSGNFLRYKAMNELIASVDKDSQLLRTTGELIETPEVNRQVMRDHIEQCYNETETQMGIVESHLNAAHADVMKEYFEVAQTTVDILESFADTVISDFSNRLTGLLQVLQTHASYDDKWSWAAWKEFHAVKESIFKLRDKIFSEAEAYRLNPRGTVPQGLANWAEFIKKMNFHVIFLLKDNDEYMKLMRAKANVAYQQREMLSIQIKTEKEDAEMKLRSEKSGLPQEENQGNSSEYSNESESMSEESVSSISEIDVSEPSNVEAEDNEASEIQEAGEVQEAGEIQEAGEVQEAGELQEAV